MSITLEDTEANQLMNILAQTKEFPWIVTNPLLMKIGAQLQANRKGNGYAEGQIERERQYPPAASRGVSTSAGDSHRTERGEESAEG